MEEFVGCCCKKCGIEEWKGSCCSFRHHGVWCQRLPSWQVVDSADARRTTLISSSWQVVDSADERMAPSDEDVEGIPAAGTGDRCADGSRISEDDRNAERICSAGFEDP